MWMPPCCLLVENYYLLVENFILRPVSDVMIGILAFFFFPEDLLGRFCCLPRDAFIIFYIAPLGPISLGGSDVTDRIHCRRYDRTLWFTKNCCDVLSLHCLRDFPFYDLHGSTSLLSFSDVTVGLLLYLILQWLVFRRCDRTSSSVILLEDPFDRSYSSTDLRAAAASLCVATVHYRAIAIGLLLNNVGSTL